MTPHAPDSPIEVGRAGAPSTAARVAILIPCYNEEPTIERVVREFQRELPEASIYVFDNNSTDRTVEVARRAGAVVGHEPRRGKGHVVRTMFRRIDADVYVMVDGDGTYPAADVHALIRPILEDAADMVIGSRLHPQSLSQFKPLNRWFGVEVTDLLSGYRVFNRRVVKCVPFMSHGFEIETELTVKCLERGYRLTEVPVNLVPRIEGSHSKINLVWDSVRILDTIVSLVRDYKPLTIFGGAGLLLIAGGLVPGAVVIQEFLATQFIRHVPLAILAVGMTLAGLLVAFAGLVLHSIARRFQELDAQMQELLSSRVAPERPADGESVG